MKNILNYWVSISCDKFFFFFMSSNIMIVLLISLIIYFNYGYNGAINLVSMCIFNFRRNIFLSWNQVSDAPLFAEAAHSWPISWFSFEIFITSQNLMESPFLYFYAARISESDLYVFLKFPIFRTFWFVNSFDCDIFY